MNKETFFEKFDILSDIPNGVEKLRELILQLAVQGRLLSQNPNDETALILLNKIKAEREQLIKEKKFKKVTILPPVDPKEMPFSIPNNWVWVRLGELGITQTGTTPKKGDNLSYGEDFSFVKPADILPNLVEYGNEGLSQEGVSKYGRLASAGSILMVCIGSIGKANLIERDCSFNQQINSLTPYNCLNSYLINYFLKSDYFQSEAWARSSRTTLAILNKGKWEKIPVPLPPLEEQKRIVAKVDQLMALCDQLESHQQKKHEKRIRLNNAALDKLLTAPTPEEFAQHWQRICDNFNLLYDAPETVGQLRQAILQLAVQGKLVAQDEGDEPASVLLEKIKGEKKKLITEMKFRKSKVLPQIEKRELPYELPDGWVWSRIGEVFLTSSGTTPKRSNHQYFINGTENWVKTTDLNNDTVVSCEEKITLQAVKDCNLKYYPPGTVCVAMYGGAGTIGKSGILGIESTVNQSVYGIYPNKYVNSDFIHFYIKSIRSEWMTFAAGLRKDPNINGKIIDRMILPLPPLEEQKRIVAKVDQLMALCNELEAWLAQAQTDGGKLMEAVVHHVLAA